MKQATKEIDGLVYTTETLPATEGLRILPKLVDLVGETGLALLMSTGEDEKTSLMANPEVNAALLSTVASRAAENDGLLVLRELMKRTKCNAIAIGEAKIDGSVYEHFDDHFAGRYMHLINVALWVGRVSFGAP
jgi:hypothetical protein